MTKTERINFTCADRDAFNRHLDEQGTALLQRVARKAIGWMVKRGRRSMVSVDHLVGVIFDKVNGSLNGGTPINDLEAFAWTVATRCISDDWRRIAREEVKVEAYSAVLPAAEWRSPEQRVIANDLATKLVRRLTPRDRETLLDGLRERSGRNEAEKKRLSQRLCRARKRARRILADLTGEAGDCLSHSFLALLLFLLDRMRRVPAHDLGSGPIICR